MIKLKLMLANLILRRNEINAIQDAIRDAGNDVKTTLNVVAQVISGITGGVAGIALLIVLVKTGFKSYRGDTGAWEDAATSLCMCVIVLALSAAVFTAFF